MEKFRTFPELHLRKVNVVRLHLQILYVSDITLADGKHIVEEHIKEQGLSLGRTTKLEWTVQPPLCRAAWRELEKAIKKICATKGKLLQPLGPWLEGLDSTWKYGVSSSNPGKIIQQIEEGITLHSNTCRS